MNTKKSELISGLKSEFLESSPKEQAAFINLLLKENTGRPEKVLRFLLGNLKVDFLALLTDKKMVYENIQNASKEVFEKISAQPFWKRFYKEMIAKNMWGTYIDFVPQEVRRVAFAEKLNRLNPRNEWSVVLKKFQSYGFSKQSDEFQMDLEAELDQKKIERMFGWLVQYLYHLDPKDRLALYAGLTLSEFKNTLWICSFHYNWGPDESENDANVLFYGLTAHRMGSLDAAIDYHRSYHPDVTTLAEAEEGIQEAFDLTISVFDEVYTFPRYHFLQAVKFIRLTTYDTVFSEFIEGLPEDKLSLVRAKYPEYLKFGSVVQKLSTNKSKLGVAGASALLKNADTVPDVLVKKIRGMGSQEKFSLAFFA